VDRQVTGAARHGASERDHEVARQVAEEAGKLLVELRGSYAPGSDPKVLRDEGDRRSLQFIMERLAELRPDDAILSEEGQDDPERLDRQRVWIIDPLDGTREYGEPPRDDWAVHVALCVDGAPVAGAVALPAQGIVYSTGATLPALSASGEPLRVVASRSRAPAVVTAVAAALNGSMVYMGSAGAKAMAILSGTVDVYIHAGGQYEWDSAAPVAVALSAGLHCSRLDGSALTYNHPNPYLPDLLICRREIAGQVLEMIQLSLRESPPTTDAETLVVQPGTMA
jgi:3'(2'), 5'-bisphosphate nucleotidase